ncbi:hypothetical protein ACCO45_010411 [Purpureocillium lilacinum]|uniref:Uncharacterized protein n=1 Tax=Purpureocillium lilacinum TaxID=33203 RepID=A0ACC4DHS8_PURLI
MTSSLPGSRELPASQYDLTTYMGRVRHSMSITDPSTLLAGATGLDKAKRLVIEYKTGKLQQMTPELWQAKKIIDATLHPDTGEPIFLPFRMSCVVLTSLVVTLGMLRPGLGTAGTIGWQIANQSVNVAINSANANKSSPMPTATLAQSYAIAVTASCSVAVGLGRLVPSLRVSDGARNALKRLVPFAAVASAGALNSYLMRRGEIGRGIDIYPALPKDTLEEDGKSDHDAPALGRSQLAAKIAVYETAASRVFNSTPIMTIPPMLLYYIQQKGAWYKRLLAREWVVTRPKVATKQYIEADSLEEEFHGMGGVGGKVWFNRGL